MFLYGVTVSPFVQRPLMAARAKGHEIEVRSIPGMALDSPEFKAISPMARIPVLELDDGTRICESGAIAAYFDEVLDGPSLRPADAVARARVRELESIATLEYATGLRPVMIHKVFGVPGGEAIVEASIVQAKRGADALDRLIGQGKFAVGDTLTLADCVLMPVLTLTTIIGDTTGVTGVLRDRPNLSAYYDRVAADPIAAQTVTQMTEGFAAMLARNAQPKS
jgi:glutathione S-transferase